ncbi:glycosyltransferase family 2 protein [Coleofasciculus sp. FACHB-64]|nr:MULTISPECIES: glycosyltransferase family A protein [unclassified Coleofasciculus]MBD1839291.1 glycosyltransferase family 2 protein [Coleofasciculus sp. FACHB-501]MBD2045632.1 glycosyltransferase family 2 protein [Coleofasciculus sp. FACHB-64]
MKFSIVITTYNRLSLLKRAIDTSLAQTFPCEVIVADDCSSDGTQAYVSGLVAALRAKGDERLVYHRNQINLGHSATMNAGVQLAKGEWIKPVDDDDYLAPNFLEEMNRAIALCPNAVIASCQAAQVDVNEVELYRTRQIGPGKAFSIPQEDLHFGMLLELIPFGTPIQVVFARWAFLKSGGWDSSLDANFDDIDSWIKIAQFGDAVFVNQCLAYRTIWPGAYNQKFPLKTRMDTNILMKEKIYALVSETHRAETPPIKNIQAYLKLHWSLVALKQGKILSAIKMAFPSVFSLSAWKILVINNLSNPRQVFLAQKQVDANSSLSKSIPYSESIHGSIVPKNRFKTAQLQELRISLKFRCSRIAFKQGEFFSAIKMAVNGVVSLGAWKIFGITDFPQSLSKKPPIQNRLLDKNILVMEKIYALVSEKHQSTISNLQDWQAYFKLRAGFLAIRQGKLAIASQMAFPAIFSFAAWKLLVKVILLRQRHHKEPLIRRLVLYRLPEGKTKD